MYGIPALSEPAIIPSRVKRKFEAQAPLTIVRAPTGSGKSVQVASWARTLEAPVEVFWFDLQEKPELAFSLMRDLGGKKDGRSRVLIMENVASLVEQDPSGGSLADFERRLLSWIASRQQLRVFLLTRIVLEVEMQLATVPFDTQFIGTDDFALTAEEIDGIAVGRNFPSSLLHAEAIRRASDGLPGPVQQYFAAFDPLEAQQLSMFTRSDPNDSLGALLVPQVKDRLLNGSAPLTPTVAAIIAATRTADPQVVHEILTLSEKGESLEIAEIEDSIAALELAGYLSGRMVAGAIEYRIPRPWAAALRHAFPEALNAISGTLKASAQWCLSNGNAADALVLALEAEDLDLAGEVTFRRSGDLENADPALWLQSIVQQGLRRLSDHPLLLMQLAQGDLKIRGYTGTDPGYFALAAKSAPKNDLLGVGRRGDIAAAGLAVIEAVAEQAGGSATAALRAAHRGLALINKLGAEQRLNIVGVLPRWLIQIGQVFMDSGQFSTAEACFRQSSSAAVGYVNLESKFHAQCLVSLCLGHKGNMGASLRYVTAVEDFGYPSDFFAGYLGDALRLAKTIINIEQGKLDKAREILAQVDGTRSHLEYRYSIAVITALLEQSSVALDQTLLPRQAILDHSRQVHPETIAEISARRAFLALRQGKFPTAVELFKEAKLRTDFVRMIGLRMALSQKDDQAFIRLLQPARLGIATRWQLGAKLLHVVFALKHNDLPAAELLMKSTLALLREGELRTPWLVLTHEEQILLRGLADNDGLHFPEQASLLWAKPVMLLESLTQRERQTLDAMASSETLFEIAEALFVTVNTAKTHRSSIYRKLGATNRNQALVRAVALGLIRKPEMLSLNEEG